jgi:hypothetical protein
MSIQNLMSKQSIRACALKFRASEQGKAMLAKARRSIMWNMGEPGACA